jgi:Protein of unknown function (DUF3040)
MNGTTLLAAGDVAAGQWRARTRSAAAATACVVHLAFARRGDDAAMSLSEDDQNSLDRIESSLLADDPLFATRVNVEAVKRSLRRRRRLVTFGFWVGLTTMIVGAGLAQGVPSIGAMVSCWGFVLLAWSTVVLIRCYRADPPAAQRQGTTEGRA